VPYKDRAVQLAAQRAHMDAKREKALAFLGGKCAVCGVKTDLHFDHIDPASKTFQISRNLNRRWEVIEAELRKCQLLCGPHHREKTKRNAEHAGGRNKGLKQPRKH
jgi:5-methylcytosine-specific restriction endonuclease McrA